MSKEAEKDSAFLAKLRAKRAKKELEGRSPSCSPASSRPVSPRPASPAPSAAGSASSSHQALVRRQPFQVADGWPTPPAIGALQAGELRLRHDQPPIHLPEDGQHSGHRRHQGEATGREQQLVLGEATASGRVGRLMLPAVPDNAPPSTPQLPAEASQQESQGTHGDSGDLHEQAAGSGINGSEQAGSSPRGVRAAWNAARGPLGDVLVIALTPLRALAALCRTQIGGVIVGLLIVSMATIMYYNAYVAGGLFTPRIPFPLGPGGRGPTVHPGSLASTASPSSYPDPWTVTNSSSTPATHSSAELVFPIKVPTLPVSFRALIDQLADDAHLINQQLKHSKDKESGTREGTEALRDILGELQAITSQLEAESARLTAGAKAHQRETTVALKAMLRELKADPTGDTPSWTDRFMAILSRYLGCRSCAPTPLGAGDKAKLRLSRLEEKVEDNLTFLASLKEELTDKLFRQLTKKLAHSVSKLKAKLGEGTSKGRVRLDDASSEKQKKRAELDAARAEERQRESSWIGRLGISRLPLPWRPAAAERMAVLIREKETALGSAEAEFSFWAWHVVRLGTVSDAADTAVALAAQLGDEVKKHLRALDEAADWLAAVKDETVARGQALQKALGGSGGLGKRQEGSAASETMDWVKAVATEWLGGGETRDS